MSAPGKDGARARILVVEDSSVFREMQGLLLGQAGYGVSSHENPQSALAIAAKEHFDLVVIDYELPNMNGQQFMHALRKIQPDIAVVFVSGALTLDLAIQLSSEGVAGIFNKPANPKTLLEKINETLARHSARDTAARVGSHSPLSSSRRSGSASPQGAGSAAGPEPTADRLAYAPRFLLGSSDRFREFTHRLWKVRDFRAVLLLQGEPGSAFEPLARELADISIFREGPVMTCPAARFDARRLIEVLAPSLLSHDAGTLIVSGVESFTAAQQKTLENLITGRDVFLPFARRFRLVLAATPELSDRVDDGSFDETLYYKISSLSLTVPSLREMRGDIVANARRILAAHHDSGHAQAPLTVAADAAAWLEAQSWPGNYDELTHTILAAADRAEGNEVSLASLAGTAASDNSSQPAVSPVNGSAPDVEIAAHDSAGARPPFPLQSDLAAPGMSAPAPASPGRHVTTAGQLFARASEPARPLTAQSLFRASSGNYNFSQRLTESLRNTDPCDAHCEVH